MTPHPIYTKTAAAKYPFVAIADQARLVREELRRRYPDTRFYVRSKTYSGGGSINVQYDGELAGAPDWQDVMDALRAYEGGSFDGMIDMGYSRKAWLTPDGRLSAGTSPGTQGSGGYHEPYDEPAPAPGAVLTHLHAHYVFVNATLPYDVKVAQR
jgi:hypothetical protein